MRDHEIEKCPDRIAFVERISQRQASGDDKVMNSIKKLIEGHSYTAKSKTLEVDRWERWGWHLVGVKHVHGQDLRGKIQKAFDEIDKVKQSVRVEQTEGKSLSQLEGMEELVVEYLKDIRKAIESRKVDISNRPDPEPIGGFGSRYDYPDIGDRLC